MHAFRNLQHARDLAGDWLLEYNYDRGHDALDGKSPVEYARSFSPLTLNAQAKGRKGKNCYVCETLQL